MAQSAIDDAVMPRLSYSKGALLIFGAGLVLGLVVVSARLDGLGRIASLAMAAGIILLPLALAADWRRARPSTARRRRKPAPAKRRGAPSRRRARRKP